jgi:lipid-binding SYLF domain-containing protein
MKTLLSLSALVFLLFNVSAQAASKQEIDVYVEEALTEFRQHTSAGAKLAASSRGMLIFPKVYKAGVGVGGEYGEGVLRVGGQNVAYYSTAAASIGFQLGAQRKAQIILFMTDAALNKFRNSDGWEAGVDGSVAIANLGAGESIDTNTAQQPIIGFIFSNEGLMFNLNLEGSKFTRIVR